MVIRIHFIHINFVYQLLYISIYLLIENLDIIRTFYLYLLDIYRDFINFMIIFNEGIIFNCFCN